VAEVSAADLPWRQLKAEGKLSSIDTSSGTKPRLRILLVAHHKIPSVENCVDDVNTYTDKILIGGRCESFKDLNSRLN
jgi:hypothetical protein